MQKQLISQALAAGHPEICKIDLLRPRQWSKTHEDKDYHGYVRQIRAIFEAKGILVAH